MNVTNHHHPVGLAAHVLMASIVLPVLVKLVIPVRCVMLPSMIVLQSHAKMVLLASMNLMGKL